MSNAASSVTRVGGSVVAASPSRRVFLVGGLIATVLAVVGFWRTYFGPLFAGAVHQPAIIHVHAVVMVTWLMLFIGQVWFAVSGRVHIHVRIGRWVMGYGLVVVATSLLATSQGFAARLSTGDVFGAQRWLFGALRDVVFFAPFLVLGYAFRRRPDIHKRMMLVATTLLILPAVTRMTFLGMPVPLWKFMLVWPIPVYVGMVHDFRAKRIIHPAYVAGIAAMLTMRLVLPLNRSAAWHAVAAHVTALYQAGSGHAQ